MKPDRHKPEDHNHSFPTGTIIPNLPDSSDIRNVIIPNCNRRFLKSEKATSLALAELLETETAQKRDVLYTIIRMSEAGTLTDEQFKLFMLAYSAASKV